MRSISRPKPTQTVASFRFRSATDVCQALEQAAHDTGTELRCGVRAERLLLATDDEATDTPRVIGAVTSHGTLHARRVILATGGQSYPMLGADGSGFALARDIGLTVTPPLPALAGLHTLESWPATLSGIVLEHALRLDVPGHPKAWLTGPVLFTHKGVSGVPALDLSGTVNALLAAARVPVSRPLMPLHFVSPARPDAVQPIGAPVSRRGDSATVARRCTLIVRRVPRAFAVALHIAEAEPCRCPCQRTCWKCSPPLCRMPDTGHRDRILGSRHGHAGWRGSRRTGSPDAGLPPPPRPFLCRRGCRP